MESVISELDCILEKLSADAEMRALLLKDGCETEFFSRLAIPMSRSLLRRLIGESIAKLSSDNHVG